MWTTLLTIVPSLFKGAGEAYKTKKVLSAAKDERKHELAVKSLDNKLEQIRLGNASDMSMDENANGRISWADDLSFLVFLTPCLLAFYPPALPSIMAGFKALENMPQWYQITLGMMLVSIWGYRKLLTPILKALVKSKLG